MRRRASCSRSTTRVVTTSEPTFTIVRVMSRMRSTPRMMPMPSGGMPKATSSPAISGSEPPGMRGDGDGGQHREQQQRDLLREPELDAEDLRDEQHDAALVERRAPHVHRRAERQHEAGDAARARPAASRATASAVGSVAALELVENAVTSTGRISREKLERAAARQEPQPQRHRPEQVQQQHGDAAGDEHAERDHDVPADLDDRRCRSSPAPRKGRAAARNARCRSSGR